MRLLGPRRSRPVRKREDLHSASGRACMVSERTENAVDENASAQIEELQQLNTKELQARFQEVFGIRAAPSNRTHLLRRLALQLQAQCDGTLSDRLLLRAFYLTGVAYPHLPRPRDVPPVAAEPQR